MITPEKEEKHSAETLKKKVLPPGRLGRWARNPQEASILALASSMGLSLVLATVMGLLLGLWLDKTFAIEPFGLLTGLLLGLVAGFKNLFVILRRIEKKSQDAGLTGPQKKFKTDKKKAQEKNDDRS